MLWQQLVCYDYDNMMSVCYGCSYSLLICYDCDNMLIYYDCNNALLIGYDCDNTLLICYILRLWLHVVSVMTTTTCCSYAITMINEYDNWLFSEAICKYFYELINHPWSISN